MVNQLLLASRDHLQRLDALRAKQTQLQLGVEELARSSASLDTSEHHCFLSTQCGEFTASFLLQSPRSTSCWPHFR